MDDYPGGPTSGATAIVIDQKAFIIDGSSFWLYDQSSNSWEQKSNFPGSPRKLATGFAINDKIYYGTGSNVIEYYNSKICYNDLWEYNPATDKWKKESDLPGIPRTGAYGYGINAKGYIVGGCQFNYNGLRDIYEYDPNLE